jgi:regulator of protease activity HflC (stomatin/prohibitin superfamily)
MAEIRRFPIWSHARVDASAYVLHYRNARLLRSGRGLTLWFLPLSDSIAEVPVDDRELTLVIHAKSADFQDVTAQGVLTYRAADPERVAERIDFSLDLASGAHAKQPLERIELMLSQLAQEFASDYIARTAIREVLTDGLVRLRERVEAGLAGDDHLRAMGIAVASVRIAGVRPSADLEKAIEAPTRESIKQQADEASFARRASAVEKERAIAENELNNRIELAKRQESLLEQEGQNARRKALDEAEAEQIAADAAAARLRVDAEAQAARERLVGAAHNQTERDRLEAYRGTTPGVLLGLAAREFAGKIDSIEHLNLTPDLLSPMLATLAGAATARLEAGG